VVSIVGSGVSTVLLPTIMTTNLDMVRQAVDIVQHVILGIMTVNGNNMSE